MLECWVKRKRVPYGPIIPFFHYFIVPLHVLHDSITPVLEPLCGVLRARIVYLRGSSQ